MPLPRTRQSRGPSPCFKSTNDRQVYRGNRSLKLFEISGRTHPVNPLAVRTPKSPQPKPNGESIEEGQYKAVKPNPFASAFGATLRSGPWKISLFLQNLIEGNANSQYHRITLLTGPPGLVHASGGSSTKPPPASYHKSPKDPFPRPPTLTNPLHFPVYSEKSYPCQTIQVDTLQSESVYLMCETGTACTAPYLEP
jgi:hypothetical protein